MARSYRGAIGLSHPADAAVNQPQTPRLLLLPALLLAILFNPNPALGAPSYFPDTLHLCTTIEPPYVIADNRNSSLRGIAIQYLQKLEEQLSFTVQHHIWDSTWSRFINTMENCSLPVRPPPAGEPARPPPSSSSSSPFSCPCHMGVGAFTRTNDRIDRVKFVWPHGNEALQMVARKSDLRVDKASSTWILFGTFSKEVWILIAVGIALHAFGTVFFHPFLGQREVEARVPAGAGWLARARAYARIVPVAVLVSYAHLLQHPFHDPAHRRLSFHRSAWFLLGLTAGFFLLSVFAASLTVLLFENERPSAFRSLSDVTGCNIDQSRVTMLRGGASHAFWNRYVNDSDTRSNCNWRKPGVAVDTIDEGFDLVLDKSNGVDFFFTSQGTVLYHSNQRCNDVVPVGEPFVFSSVAFVLPKGTDDRIKEDLDRETRLLRERDAYPSAMMMAARDECDRSRDATITFVQLRIFFILYIVIWTLLVVFRIGFLYRRRRRRQAEVRR